MFGAIVGEYFVRWADELGFYSVPHFPVAQTAAWLGWAIDTFYLRYAATFLAGLLLGWRVGLSAYRQIKDEAAASKDQIKQLGQRSLVLAARIDGHLRASPHRRAGKPEDFFGEISSVFTGLERLGVELPDIKPDIDHLSYLRVVSQFLKSMGPLIRDGHVNKAKLIATAANQKYRNRS